MYSHNLQIDVSQNGPVNALGHWQSLPLPGLVEHIPPLRQRHSFCVGLSPRWNDVLARYLVI
jgi:hypothetical protein